MDFSRDPYAQMSSSASHRVRAQPMEQVLKYFGPVSSVDQQEQQ